MPTAELEAMHKIDALLSVLETDVRGRVIRWAAEKYAALQPVAVSTRPRSAPALSQELPGVAKLQDGRLRLTIRDVKARNTRDAAVRLAHIILLAHEQLTGKADVSSRAVLVPLLREWRAYDGNTRKALARCKGIVRNGDSVSLDIHARREAEGYVRDVLDAEKVGAWSPGARRRSLHRR